MRSRCSPPHLVCLRRCGIGAASAGAAFAVLSLAAPPGPPTNPPQRLHERGEQLYRGEIALAARLRGHAHPLPVAATRCINCHALDAQVQGFAAPLTRASLRVARPRHGGPPSAYDSRSFCQVLRTGVDPKNVLLPSAMPNYALSDPDCEALWAFLTTPPRSDHAAR